MRKKELEEKVMLLEKEFNLLKKQTECKHGLLGQKIVLYYSLFSRTHKMCTSCGKILDSYAAEDFEKIRYQLLREQSELAKDIVDGIEDKSQ
jgi:hypothetical protein